MKNDITKLPKWAQEEIKFLQMKAEALTDKVKELSNVNAGTVDTNTRIIEGLGSRPLPMNTQIEFAVGDKLQNKVCIYIKRDGTIDVHADSRDGSRFVFAPRAANAGLLIFVPES